MGTRGTAKDGMAHDDVDDEALDFEDAKWSAGSSVTKSPKRRRTRWDNPGAERPVTMGAGPRAPPSQADVRASNNARRSEAAMQNNRRILLAMQRRTAARAPHFHSNCGPNSEKMHM